MAKVIVTQGGAKKAVSRRREQVWLLAVSLFLAFGLVLLYFEKSENFDTVRSRLADGVYVNLNDLEQTNQTLLAEAFTDLLADEEDRTFLAGQLFEQVRAGRGGLPGLTDGVPNVGILNRTVTAEAIEERGGPLFRARLEATRERLGLTPEVVAQETSEAPPGYPAQQDSAGLSISGQVEDAEGAPLGGTLVVLQGSGRADTLRTDASGRYAFSGLEAGGSYAVRPVHPNQAFTSQQLESLQEPHTANFTGQPFRLPLFESFDAFLMVKERFVVRSPDAYLTRYLLLSAIFFAMFWGIHFFWRRRRFSGDSLLLPIVMGLTGLSLLLMFSLPDPLRDRFLAQEVVIGVVIGGFLLALVSQLDLQRWGYRAAYGGAKSFIWVGLAVLLSIMLLLFGSGPTGSEGAKVNLEIGPLSVQPVEVIKACLLLFFAGYFARNWEFLRQLEEGTMPQWMRKVGLSVPRLRFAVPVIIGVALALAFFILQRDLGPALVLCTTFLMLYGIVRQRWVAVVLGFLALIGSFWFVYTYDLVPTVVSRIEMMESPWDNNAAGGEHLAQVYWALTTGGIFGQGLGEGATLVVPAAHTDMVMAVIGEELGLLGILGVLTLYAVLFHRGLLIALRAGTTFSFFLGVGIVVSSALQLGLIVGGMTGIVPLSGVVSPLLSYGKSALIMHLIFIGALFSISAQGGAAEERTLMLQRFGQPVRVVGVAVFVLLLGLGLRAAYIQVLKVNDWIIKPALVRQADGRRGFAYNARIRQALDRIRMGTLYDRHGVPLATSDPAVLDSSAFAGFNVDAASLRQRGPSQERIYPFGALTFYLLGDYNPSRIKWGDARGLYAERRFLSRLRGYDNRPDREQGVDYAFELPDPDNPDETYTVSYYDYRELIPYLRAGLDSRKSRAFFEAKRDYRLTIDIRLQQRVTEAIRTAIGQDPNLRDRFISAVVMNATNGEMLASVTYPLPEDIEEDPYGKEYFDHALYANKPPGSTFKLATAMAAFRAMGDEAADWTTTVSPGTRFMRTGGPTGRVTMELAIENSSNIYFGRLAEEAGAEEMLNVIDAIGALHGFGQQTRQEAVEDITRYTNLTQAGFGQGMVLASPLSIARLTATVANDGRLMPTRWLLADTLGTDSTEAGQQLITPSQARALASYMRRVVVGPRGTARRLSTLSVPVAGKTGTAEQDLFEGGRELGRVTHAWFTGYAPYGIDYGDKIAVAVLVESERSDLPRPRLSGGRDAGTIAGAIFEAAADLGYIYRDPSAMPAPDSTAMAQVVDLD